MLSGEAAHINFIVIEWNSRYDALWDKHTNHYITDVALLTLKACWIWDWVVMILKFDLGGVRLLIGSKWLTVVTAGDDWIVTGADDLGGVLFPFLFGVVCICCCAISLLYKINTLTDQIEPKPYSY